MKLNIRIGIDCEQSFGKSFCLEFSNIRGSIILTVEVGKFYLVAVNDSNLLEPKTQRTFGDYAADTCAPQENSCTPYLV